MSLDFVISELTGAEYWAVCCDQHTGSVGMHYLWQVNKKMVSEDNVFCVSKIISDSDQFVMLVANMYSLVGHVYLNGDRVISSNNPKELGKPQKVKLKKGVNDLFIHAQCYGEPWFVIQVYPKYSQFEGLIKYENGNIAPFTRIGLYDNSLSAHIFFVIIKIASEVKKTDRFKHSGI